MTVLNSVAAVCECGYTAVADDAADAADDAADASERALCLRPTTVRETSGQPMLASTTTTTTTTTNAAAADCYCYFLCADICVWYLYAYVHTHTRKHTARAMHWYSFGNSLSLSVRGALLVYPSHSLTHACRCAVCFVSLIFHCIAHTLIHTNISLPCWPLRHLAPPWNASLRSVSFPLRSLYTTRTVAQCRCCCCCFCFSLSLH